MRRVLFLSCAPVTPYALVASPLRCTSTGGGDGGDNGEGTRGEKRLPATPILDRIQSRAANSRPPAELLPTHLRPGKDVSHHSRRIVPTALEEFDDDEAAGAHAMHHGGDQHGALSTSSRAVVPSSRIDEFELLDDAYTYFPLVGADGAPRNSSYTGIDGSEDEKHEAYVPGQQVIEPGVTRYRVDVQYIGSDFDGWYKSTEKRRVTRSSQSGITTAVPLDEKDDAVSADIKMRARTVLEDALAIALDVDRVKVEAAAIPEAGCSVRRLTCHVDIPETVALQPRTIMQRATMWLEKKQAPLAVLSCLPCRNQQFHARHSGTRRVYVYRILNRIAPPLFDAGLQWHVDRHLDTDRMSRFAEKLTGTMDYGYFADPKMGSTLRREANRTAFSGPSSTFLGGERAWKQGSVHVDRRVGSGLSGGRGGMEQLGGDAAGDAFGLNLATVRTIDSIRVVRQDDEVLLWFAGKSFLRHQIRSMVAVLKMAGQGLWTEQELDQALKRGFSSSRTKAERERPLPAPVHGLTLWDVEYPPQHRDDYVSYVDSGVLPLDGEDVRVVNV